MFTDNKMKKGIEARLRYALKPLVGQESGKESIVKLLVDSLVIPIESKIETTDRITSISIYGGPGTGKSFVVELLRHFFDMSDGDPYSKQYIQLNLGYFSDSSHINIFITGVQPNFIGYADGDNSLVARLIKATERVNEEKDNPYILLHFDEACKASPVLMNAINPLLSHGKLQATNGNTFTVPTGTRLFCIFTSSYPLIARNEEEFHCYQRMPSPILFT